MAIIMITTTESTTRISGTTENSASPRFICLLTRRNRIPEKRVANPARKKENKLKYIIPPDVGMGVCVPPAINIYLRNKSKRSMTKPNARSEILVLDHAKNVRSLAMWLRCQARKIRSSLAMSGGREICWPKILSWDDGPFCMCSSVAMHSIDMSDADLSSLHRLKVKNKDQVFRVWGTEYHDVRSKTTDERDRMLVLDLTIRFSHNKIAMSCGAFRQQPEVSNA